MVHFRKYAVNLNYDKSIPPVSGDLLAIKYYWLMMVLLECGQRNSIFEDLTIV